MHVAKPDPSSRLNLRRRSLIALVALPLLLSSSAPVSRDANSNAGSIIASGEALAPAASAVVNFTDLARRTQERVGPAPPVRPLLFPELEEPAEVPAPASMGSLLNSLPSFSRSGSPVVNVASPSPTNNYMGLDDIPMVDSSYIIIPPDVAGGVGPNKVMESFNNNYRIRDKATGVTQSTVGTATFWAAVTTGAERLSLTDPRTTYDPYNNRWIVCMQTTGLAGSILVGVSATSDPAGSWFLYKFTGLSGSLGGAYQLDFPILGFNKNWVAVTINRYTSAGAFSYGVCLALDYPLLRTGTGTGTLFTLNSGGGSTHFCASPAVTYSAVEDSLFLVIHLSSGGATYAMDVISGTSGAPVYNLAAASNVRTGGGWTQPSGNIQPQSAPNAGTSVCAPPCKIESADAQVRAAPIYRNGFVYYAQTVGLPAGTLTRTAAQWTKVTPSTTPAFADGGRVDDPTATATNGGKWHDHASLSVNGSNDVMIGFTQFSSAQHPSAGYAMHLGTDAPGTTRDPFIYKVGDDYYHKTFSTATGRNRWGDFTTVQVDPCDDQTLWTLQEYGKTRTGTDDGNTGSNSSKWSSWWAAVGGLQAVASVTCPADTAGDPGATVTRKFRITNIGTASGAFNYTITDVSSWGGPVSGTTPVLAPSSFFDVFVNFNIPTNCTPPSDVVTLTASLVGTAGCNAPVSCTTRIFCDIATAALVSSFDANMATEGVNLAWWSEAVGEVSAWNVYRARTENGGWTRVNASPIAMGSGGQFRLHDGEVVSGDMFYRLSGVMPGGTEQVVSTTRVTAGGSSLSFAIIGSNPFTGRTTLRYSVPRAERVRLDVYTVSGQHVRSLVDRTETPGAHTVEFALRGDGRSLAPGIYMARLTVGTQQKTLRLVGME